MDLITDVLIPAIAKAVVGKLFDEGIRFAQAQVKKDDKPDPAVVAFQLALGKSYLAFRRRYPEITSELFTEPFLANEAAPILADLACGKDIRALDFAHTWVNTERHHIHDGELKRNGQPTARAIEASEYFLHLLRSELRHSPYFQQAFDSNALDELPKIVSSLSDLEKALVKVTQEIQAPSASTAGGAAIWGDLHVEGDFVNRDKIINQYFLRSFPVNLQGYYTRPDEIFDRVDVPNFVGREKLQEEIKGFINQWC